MGSNLSVDVKANLRARHLRVCKTKVQRKQGNKKLLENLKPGDLLVFGRFGYNHWAVYIGYHKGKRCVVHLNGGAGRTCLCPDTHNATLRCPDSKNECKSCGGRICGISIAKYLNVAKNDAAVLCSRDWCRSFSQKEIVTRALAMVGRAKYNLLKRNCEHFATWCRNSIPNSVQSLRNVTDQHRYVRESFDADPKMNLSLIKEVLGVNFGDHDVDMDYVNKCLNLKMTL